MTNRLVKGSKAATCLLLILLSACAAPASAPEAEPSESPVTRIEGIIIRNQLRYPVTDVMVEVPATGEFAGCGNIVQRTACSTSFPAADYRLNAIVIRWKEQGEPQSTDEFVVAVPDGMVHGTSAWLEVIVFAKGQAGARLITDPGP